MKIRLLILCFCLFAGNLWAAELKGSCQINFSGTSTLHDFSGTASCEPFVVALDSQQPAGLRLVGETVEVAVADMDTDNNKRDKKMRAMFEADRFPFISGRIEALSPQVIERLAAAARGNVNTQIKTHLKIRDTDLPQTARVSKILEDESQLELELEFELSLKAYQLKPPSFLGLIRVGDRVKVKIHLLLEKIGQVPKQILN